MATTNVLTHRGLDPSRKGYFAESSLEAFEDQLARGYGLEFDLRPDLTISHSKDLTLAPEQGTLTTLPELLERIHTAGLRSALHLKSYVQDDPALLDTLLSHDLSEVIIFDVTIKTAQYLKSKNPALTLAPSVAHPYDIERYNSAVGGTLYTIDEVLAHRELFDWAWLDEWDRADKNGGSKTFYNADTFARLREAGLKIALVTPELHGTSPGLLGGEAHEDARDHEALMARIEEIIDLKPDLVCTDYPDEVRTLIGS
jgi:hypothetical protein